MAPRWNHRSRTRLSQKRSGRGSPGWFGHQRRFGGSDPEHRPPRARTELDRRLPKEGGGAVIETGQRHDPALRGSGEVCGCSSRYIHRQIVPRTLLWRTEACSARRAIGFDLICMKTFLTLVLASVSLNALAGEWKQLPSLPDAEGFAGSFAGVSNGALLVAGGTNFPGKKPWEGGAKVWYDTVYVLESAN